MVGAMGLAEARRAGWFGKVVKSDGRGTSNVGIFGGKDNKPAGDATNVVTDYAFIKGEARSPESAFATKIAKGYEEAFAKAQIEVTDDAGDTAGVKFSHVAAYPPFELGKDTAIVRRATKALQALGMEPVYVFSNGGLDANWLDKHGVPTVTIGSGQAEIHTIKEYVNLLEFEKGCRIGVLMATLDD
jgi:tripeptide aminopeptidase